MAALEDSRTYQLLKEIESRELAENCLYEFLKQSWPIIEGGQEFYEGWHIKAICDHLEAVVRRDIQHLIINVPPRSSKTSAISIAFCAWTWLKRPWEAFYYASHTASLAKDHSIKCRRIIESEWYQTRWGDRYKLVGDQNTKSKFENDKGGYREAGSVGSKTAGKGGTILILDDPNDTNESDTIRQEVNKWIEQTWSSRLNNRKTGCKIIVQQRTHEDDVTGRLANKTWTQLILPLEFIPGRKCKTIPLPHTNGKPWEDPRHIEGEILWPNYWGPTQVKQMKLELKNQYNISGQLQQLPSPEEGGLIKRNWFQHWKHPYPPKTEQIIQSWDTALGDDKSHCYSACTTWATFLDSNGVYNLILLSLFRAQIEYPELRKMAQRLYTNYNDCNPDVPITDDGCHKVDLVIVENKSTGGSLIQELHRAGIPATGFNPDKHGDKNVRVKKNTHYIERGQVWMPARPPDFKSLRGFADLFVNECAMFPAGKSRDLVDTLAQVLIRLGTDGWLADPKFDGFEESTPSYRPTRALYGE